MDKNTFLAQLDKRISVETFPNRNEFTSEPYGIWFKPLDNDILINYIDVVGVEDYEIYIDLTNLVGCSGNNPPTETGCVRFYKNLPETETIPDTFAGEALSKLYPADGNGGFPIAETIICSASAVGLYVVGSLLKESRYALILKLATVIPISVLIYLLYDYFKDFEFPFSSETELEVLAQ